MTRSLESRILTTYFDFSNSFSHLKYLITIKVYIQSKCLYAKAIYVAFNEASFIFWCFLFFFVFLPNNRKPVYFHNCHLFEMTKFKHCIEILGGQSEHILYKTNNLGHITGQITYIIYMLPPCIKMIKQRQTGGQKYVTNKVLY